MSVDRGRKLAVGSQKHINRFEPKILFGFDLYLNILTFTAFLIRLDLISNYFNCGYAQAVIPNDRKDVYSKTHPAGKTL